MNVVTKALTLITMLVLVSCATTYGPLGPSGGYSEVWLGGDDFDVSFKGNPLIESAEVKEFLLIRCAEITLEHGHESFVIWADSSFSETSTSRGNRDQPWKTGSSSINQATVNPDVTIDTKQTWFTARYIIQTLPTGSMAHKHAQLNAKQVMAERMHLLKK